MLGVNLKETRIYQDAKAEGREQLKLELVPRMLARGLTIQEVAELLDLTPEQVRLVTQQNSGQ